jgi:hypothetical protein
MRGEWPLKSCLGGLRLDASCVTARAPAVNPSEIGITSSLIINSFKFAFRIGIFTAALALSTLTVTSHVCGYYNNTRYGCGPRSIRRRSQQNGPHIPPVAQEGGARQ